MIINSNDIKEIVKAINEVTNPTCFDYIQLFFTVFFSLVTSCVAILTLRLQKKIKENDDADRHIVEVQHISNVYYFLNDIINKIADIEFEYSLFESIVIDGQKYMEDINYLRYKYIDNNEFNLLKDLYALYDGIHKNPKENNRNFKLLYKKVIDTNIEPIEIANYRNTNDFNYVISIKLLRIIKKLENALNNKYDIINDKIIIDMKNDKIKSITKNYDKKYYLTFTDDLITGYVKKYEPVFHFNSEKINITYELIYKGNVSNNNPSGKGEYYYHTENNGFNRKINSCDLKIHGTNYDPIAQKIKELLADESSDGHFVATFKGTFKNNSIKNGTLIYLLNPTTKEKIIKVNNN